MLVGRPWSRKWCDVKGYTNPALYRPSESQTWGIYRLQILDPEMFLQGPERPELVSLMSEKRGVILSTTPASTWSWLPLWGSGRHVSPCMETQSLSKQLTRLPPSPSCSQQPRPSLHLHAPPAPSPHLQSTPRGAPKGCGSGPQRQCLFYPTF